MTGSSDNDSVLLAARQQSLPRVARPPNPWTLPLGVAGIALLGVVTFAALRPKPASPPPTQTQMTAGSSPSAALPPPPSLAPVAAVPQVVATAARPAPPIAIPVAPIAPVSAPIWPPTTPVLLIDNTVGESAPADPAKAAETGAEKLSPNEAFADRLTRSRPESVGTDKLASTDLVVPQGTIITAVLETAIDSDLPGMVRAVVSRDVVGFDATKVLIPKGSRLVGQYSSGVALGQSRAFVIWTRVLRSDGVSVQLGSAATDPLGTAGLGGKVNSHFLKRFGSAILLSVVTGALEYLVNSADKGSQVLIANTAQANQLASIALQRQIDIAPTIKVAQGTPVRVFVARDLDFGATREKQR